MAVGGLEGKSSRAEDVELCRGRSELRQCRGGVGHWELVMDADGTVGVGPICCRRHNETTSGQF